MKPPHATNYRARRFVALLIAAIVSLSAAAVDFYRTASQDAQSEITTEVTQRTNREDLALTQLSQLEVKGRAAKTGYQRSEFGAGWQSDAVGCTTRNLVLQRDLKDAELDEKCRVLRGTLSDPYTGKDVTFLRGENTSADVQIDHVVSLSNAWQTGAQLLERPKRVALANDLINLLAVDGAANQQKGDGDAATWLPPNKVYRCAYVARQIAVKYTYNLWVTSAEKEAMVRVLGKCPYQPALVSS